MAASSAALLVITSVRDMSNGKNEENLTFILIELKYLINYKFK